MKVLLVGSEGQQLGVMSTNEALLTSQEQGLDLIMVAPNADPPVCRIADYGKLRYQAAKRTRKSKQSQKSNELKEVRLRPNIGEHDLSVKVQKVREFIGNGANVKLTVRFRGREMAHQSLGLDVLKRVANELQDVVRLEKQPISEGRNMIMTLMPKQREV